MGNCCSSKSDEDPIFDNSPSTQTTDVPGSSPSISNAQVQLLSFIPTLHTNNVHQDISTGQCENRKGTPDSKSAPINCTKNVQVEPLSIISTSYTNNVPQYSSTGQFENRKKTPARKSSYINNVQVQPHPVNSDRHTNNIQEDTSTEQFENKKITPARKSSCRNSTNNVQVQPHPVNSDRHTNNVQEDISTEQFENKQRTPARKTSCTNSRNSVQVQPHSFNYNRHTNYVQEDSTGQFENRQITTAAKASRTNCASNEGLETVIRKVGTNPSLTIQSVAPSGASNVQFQPFPFNFIQQTSVHRDISSGIFPFTGTNNVQIRPSLFNNSNSFHQNISTLNSYHANGHHFQIQRVYESNSIAVSVSTCSVTIISIADMKRFQQILYSAVLRLSRTLNWFYADWNVIPTNQDFQVIPVQPGSYECNDILQLFSNSLSGNTYSIIKVSRVENPYLLGQYYLKKLEYQNKGLPIENRYLFHGTKRVNVYNICSNNFDWRLYGQTKGNKFEQGVCFTPTSRYANHYCDVIGVKAIILARVFVSKICEANRVMPIPDYYDKKRLLRYDTSLRQNNENILVKYSDDEFYPAYIIHFVGKIFYPNKGNGYFR